jgi:hypothetical protein
MTDTIEIEILPFADFIIDLGSMSPPAIPEGDGGGQGLVENEEL